ncbi:hypothetical protein FDF74_09060 [Clostridium niameyense]|uniref:Uncharacterized protein n=1 Tax=Clostridium niameyense TaxID=1622073 RepID=A0A6M0RAP9_9CLOT|nr:hypothetical protein [Clostridium niameyense]NEZ47341.1 hypothetical protein [Clostridium niameyense]
MGNMYKETIIRKRVPVLLFVIILLTISLYLMEFIKGLKINVYNIQQILNNLIIAFLILISLFEIVKCKVRYTYFIIADQFIIHKIKGSEDKVVENIKLKDIIYFGKTNRIKSKFMLTNCKKYTCSLFNGEAYYCIYKKGDKTKKFYFEPSYNLIKKLEYFSNKRLAS